MVKLKIEEKMNSKAQDIGYSDEELKLAPWIDSAMDMELKILGVDT